MEPKLIAEFALDKNGRLKTYPGKKYKHFWIKLSVKDAPPDTYSVTYLLHESYKDRVREIPVDVPGFEEEISSYGDYTITVTANGKNPQAFASKLSEALKRKYEGGESNEIREAITQIERM